jgi:hypothetical protein
MTIATWTDEIVSVVKVNPDPRDCGTSLDNPRSWQSSLAEMAEQKSDFLDLLHRSLP